MTILSCVYTCDRENSIFVVIYYKFVNMIKEYCLGNYRFSFASVKLTNDETLLGSIIDTHLSSDASYDNDGNQSVSNLIQNRIH